MNENVYEYKKKSKSCSNIDEINIFYKYQIYGEASDD